MCGVDPGLSYYKIQYASMCLLQNPGCLFIATNADARGHFTPNQEWAGAGASVGAIKGTDRIVLIRLNAYLQLYILTSAFIDIIMLL